MFLCQVEIIIHGCHQVRQLHVTASAQPVPGPVQILLYAQSLRQRAAKYSSSSSMAGSCSDCTRV
jgi:hypothetical protein